MEILSYVLSIVASAAMIVYVVVALRHDARNGR